MRVFGRDHREPRSVVADSIEPRIVGHARLTATGREVDVLVRFVDVLDLSDVPFTGRDLVLQHSAAELGRREVDLAIGRRRARRPRRRARLGNRRSSTSVEPIHVRPTVPLRPPESIGPILGHVPAHRIKRRRPNLDERLTRITRDDVHRATLRVDRCEISTL